MLDEVHRAGGLYIADEVQSGFGRIGAGWWGFQRHGIVPDIVTIGKPMGNGLPIAAAVFDPDLLVDFGRKIRYFNTFGGNTVSIAAAQAVLDVIRDEGLIENAAQVGAQLIAGVDAITAGMRRGRAGPRRRALHRRRDGHRRPEHRPRSASYSASGPRRSCPTRVYVSRRAH